jgi:hypothetical protein
MNRVFGMYRGFNYTHIVIQNYIVITTLYDRQAFRNIGHVFKMNESTYGPPRLARSTTVLYVAASKGCNIET